MEEINRIYNVWLVGVEGIGSRSMGRLLEHFETAEQVYMYVKQQIRDGKTPEILQGLLTPTQIDNLVAAALLEPKAEYEAMLRKGIGCTTYLDGDYPTRLTNIPDPPAAIYYLGSLPQESDISVSIIGARKCSPYGREVAIELGRVMADKGITVISGMAAGIDGISQNSCLDNNGKSYAVLGSGVDVCYPPSNRGLYEKLIAEGGVLSEYKPGTLARASLFPPRNRLVSGLSDAVIVVEAGMKSGTLITVDMALEQGKDVHVVPGRITDRLSDGCNCLLAQGASVVLSPEMTAGNILKGGVTINRITKPSIRLQGAMKVTDKRTAESIPEGCMRDVFRQLSLDPLSCEDIETALQNRFSIAEIRSACLELVLINRAFQVSPGHFTIKR